MPSNVALCSYRISPTRRLLLALTAGATLFLPPALSSAEASICSVLGAGTYIPSGSTSIQPTALDPAKRYCLTRRTDLTIGKGTVAPNGTLDVYTSFVFTGNLLNNTSHINTVLLLDTTIASAPAPDTAFLRFHPLPISGTLAATRVNLLNVEIGENRSMQLVKQSGLAQFQDVYISSTTPRTYQNFSISNPQLVTIGAYNLTGQTFTRQTQLTLKRSTITNGKLLAVKSGSSLKLDASTVDTELVRLDGTLAGNGTVRGAAGTGSNTTFLATSGSALSPGLSIGTLSVQGTMNLVGPTSLISEINPNAAQKADLLTVSGALSGARNLTVTLEKDSSYSATGAGEVADFTGSTYTVLTAGSIDSDAISLVEGGSLNAHLSARLVGQPTTSGQVVVGFSDNSATPGHVPSKLPASTPWSVLASAIAATHHNTVVNGSAGGGTAPGGTGSSNGGQQILNNGQTVSTAWLGLTNAQVGQLDRVHAEPFSSNLTVGLEQLEHVASSVMARMSGRDGKRSNGNVLWTDVSYVRGHVDGKNGLGSFGYSLSNMLVGTDLVERERFNGGVFAGYGTKQMHEHDKVAQDFNGQKAFAGVYATAQTARFDFSAVAGYGHGWHTSRRINPNVGLFTGGSATASYTSKSAFASAQLGYRVQIDENTEITPFLAASYSRIWQDGLTETGGGDFNYTIAAAGADSLTGGFGVNFNKDLPNIEAGRDLSLTSFLRYDHDFEAANSRAHRVTATSHLFGRFAQTGQNRGAHIVTGGVGLSGSWNEKVSMRAGFTGSYTQHGHEVGASAHLKVKF